VIAHLAFEVAAVKDLQLDIERLEGTCVQDGTTQLIFMSLDLIRVVHLNSYAIIGELWRGTQVHR
jgi:hypothetical protein